MSDAAGEVARIMSSVGFAVFALVLMTLMRGTRFKLMLHSLMIVAFATSGLILFSTTVLKLPGIPATMVASFMWLLSIVTFRIARIQRESRSIDG